MNNKLKRLKQLIEEHGIDKAIEMIDIESIDNLSVKIILRTYKTSKEHLMQELDEALS